MMAMGIRLFRRSSPPIFERTIPRGSSDSEAVKEERDAREQRSGILVHCARRRARSRPPAVDSAGVLGGLPDVVHSGEIATTGTVTRATPLQPGQHWEHRLSASIELELVKLRIQ